MKRKVTALLLVLTLCLSVLAGCGGSDDKGGDGDKASAKIILVLEDQSEVPYDISVTAGASLRDALLEAELITEDTYYGMFIEDIDGHIADVMNDGCTWLPCDADGNALSGDVDTIAVNDGDTIKMVYYVVPNYDD